MRSKIILFTIILLAALLRFVSLGTNPPSLTWDEVSWGYNAYSLGLDGKDEFGKFLPITYLESFGDFKPPMYAYLSIIPVKILGLTEFSVRFTSALFGVLTVLLTYFLTKKIFKNNNGIALISALVLAISPWHIMLSRGAFEANVATFFIVLGILLFFVFLEKKRYIIVFSFLSFVLSMYTFNTARIVSPAIVCILVFVFRKELLKIKKEVLVGIIVSFVVIFPLLLFLKTPQASLRFKEVNIFSDIKVIERVNQQIENDKNAWWSKIIHNRRFAYGTEFLKHYFDNLNPSFLFIKGDGNPKFSVQDVGQLYVWEIPFFVFGLIFLFLKKEGKWWIIPLWIFIGIIPAATARETPHALRIETILPAFQLITGYGLYNIIQKIKSVKSKQLFISAVTVVIVVNLLYFLHIYVNHYSREYSREWQYGYKEAIKYINNVENDYDRIVFTQELGRPYIYFLFYKKYNPALFAKQAEIEREALGFVHVRSFGKYKFMDNISAEKLNKKTLFIATSSQVLPGARIIKTFKELDGNVALVAYTL